MGKNDLIELNINIEIKNREDFIEKYRLFYDWLEGIGFKRKRVILPLPTKLPIDFRSIDGIFYYFHDFLKCYFIFMTDCKEHKIAILHMDSTVASIHNIEETKNKLINEVKEAKNNIQKQLDAIPF